MIYANLFVIFCVFFVKLGDGEDATLPNVEVHGFVGRVDGVLLEAEAHEDCLAAEDGFEGSDDGYGAASTCGERPFAKGYLETVFCCPISRYIDGADIALAAVHRRDGDSDALGSEGLHIVDESLRDAFVVLISDEATAHFGKRIGRQDRLGALACIASPYTTDIERRPAGVTLERAVALFAEDVADADGPVVGLLVEGYLRYHGAFGFGDRQHIVVEMRDSDPSVVVHYLGEHLAEGIEGVLDGSAEVPRVEVTVRPIDLDLPIGESTKAGRDRGRLFAYHGGVGHKDDIRFEQFTVVLQKGLERGRADLFLAFEDELDVTTHLSCPDEVLKGFDLNHRLSFVVVCAAGIESSVTDSRFPRIGVPEFEGFDRHHVVVGVDQNG